MRYLMLQYRHPDTRALVSYLEALFALTDEIEILAAASSFRRQDGVVLIAWNGPIDLAFLQQLNEDRDIADYCILTAPSDACGVLTGQSSQGSVPVPLPIRAEEEDEPPMVLRGPFPRSWYEEGRE